MADEIEAEVTGSTGGVQGDDGAPGGDAAITSAPPVAAPPADAPAPDAGEMEWAGALVKKPPAPGA